MSWDDVIVSLKQHGLDSGRHYALGYVTPGAVLPVSVSADPNHQVELAAFSERALVILRDVEVRIRVVDSAGDTHERICSCLYSAHAVTGIAYGSPEYAGSDPAATPVAPSRTRTPPPAIPPRSAAPQ